MTGELGLPETTLGSLVQTLGRILIDRDHDADEVLAKLADFHEDNWWQERGGEIVDDFAKWLGLDPWPGEPPYRDDEAPGFAHRRSGTVTIKEDQ
jgi:hypothetical protein